MEELYFVLHLTENEHYIVEDELRRKAKLYDVEVIYYRILKEGHVPMHREVKLRGSKFGINKVKKYIKSKESFHLIKNVVRNPHRLSEEDWLVKMGL